MIKDSITKRIEPVKIVYSHQQLEEFNAKYIEPYRKEVFLEAYQETVRVPNWPEIYFQANVMTRDGRIRIEAFVEFQEKYRQWQKMMDERYYAIENKNKQLEDLNKDKIDLEKAFKDF